MTDIWQRLAAHRAATEDRTIAALFEAAADGIGAASRQPDRPEHLTRRRWSGLMNDARLARQADIHERCARELHALHVQLPERQAWRTYDDAALQEQFPYMEALKAALDNAGMIAGGGSREELQSFIQADSAITSSSVTCGWISSGSGAA